ncbi:alpha/beta hydrolase [Lapillicoccus sp.]|uniref:alpha/beta hydrolase n=1 Tax=Lapillicoccus sp. TaxID=1909287 RepID=UPI0025EE20D3|nr:alpha/beta hydrolase [Lapillicoccus sp.]
MRPPPDVAEQGHYPVVGEDPTLVRVLSSALADLRDELRALGPAVAREVPSLRTAWPQGRDGDLAVLDVIRTRTFADAVVPPFGVAADALSQYADDLAAGRRAVRVLNGAFVALSPVAAHLASLAVPTTTAQMVERDRAETDVRLAAAATGFVSVGDIDVAYEVLVARVTIASEECAEALRGVTAAQSVVGSVPGASVFAGGLHLLADGGLGTSLRRAGLSTFPDSPLLVAAFWATLTGVERQAVLASDPARFGNLDGIPVRDRDSVNRTRLEGEIADGDAWFVAHGIPLPHGQADLDRLTPWQRVRLGLLDLPTLLLVRPVLPTQAQAARRLGRYREDLAVRDTLAFGDAHLMTFDPGAFQGEGRVAIAFGDPDSADNITLCVPGLESRVAKMTQVGSDARRLYEESAAADRAHPTAVIAWQGYDAPSFLTVASSAQAEAGAVLLASDVRGLVATHGNDPTITVVGHSYGSTVTGLALQQHGLAQDVDSVALIGSCGVGGSARTVVDLGLRDDQLFVGTASRDVINATSNTLLGKDPLDPDFGGTRFRTESVERDRPGLADVTGITDHSRYYDQANHSESLYSLADIASGHGDQLRAHDMVADRPNRVRVPLYDAPPVSPPGLPPIVLPAPFPPPYVDPEYARPATSGHLHEEP